MHDWRRKKKVLAQLEALVRKNAEGNKAPTPAHTTPPANTQTLDKVAGKVGSYPQQQTRGAAPTGGGSILNRLKRANDQIQQEVQEQTPNPNQAQTYIPLDKGSLNAAWRTFANSLPVSDNYLRTIMASDPKISGDDIIVDIVNSSQNMICEHAELINFLRTNLRNPNIVIKTNLVEKKEENSATPFTAKQKLDVLLADNNNLHKLIEQFGLSFDY